MLNESQIFFMEMESLASSSSWAVGKILRYVLPFNEDASSSDQSAVAAMYIDVPSELKPQEASLQMLRNLAVRLRKLMRIKMADETDFKQVSGLDNRCYHLINYVIILQARTAARMLLLWSRELKKVSSSTNMPMYQIVKNLQNTL